VKRYEFSLTFERSELRSTDVANRAVKEDRISIGLEIKQFTFQGKREIISFQGKSLQDQALIAQNKEAVAKGVLADRNANPEKTLLLLDDGIKKEKIECRHHPLDYKVQVRATGKAVDLDKEINRLSRDGPEK
jgi:hypothetical protein